MRLSTISALRCPFGGGALKVDSILEGSQDNIQFGKVTCENSPLVFPIVAGVLILGQPDQRINTYIEITQDYIYPGPRIDELCQAIDNGNCLEAFSLLLNPSAANPDFLLHPQRKSIKAKEWMGPQYAVPKLNPYSWLAGVLRIQKKLARYPHRLLSKLGDRFANGLLLRNARKHLAKFLLTHQQDLTAIEVIDLYYGQYSWAEVMKNYFMFKFGQPRYPAALSLTSILREKDGPVVDLACGAGHLTHHLSHERKQPVFGIDRDFFRLYLATNFIAPEADFICYQADQILPFADASVGGVFCADAFAYFENQARCIQEAERVLNEDGMIALARIGNRDREPHNGGNPLSIEGYHQLFKSMPHVLLGEDALRAAYLQQQAPNLERRETDDAIRDEVMLCAVLSKQEKDFRDYGQFVEYPHSQGLLLLNPLYSPQEQGSKGLKLKFEFPAKWYAFEDAKCLEYAPDSVEIPDEVLMDILANNHTDAVRKLIANFVLVGLPKRFIPTRITC